MEMTIETVAKAAVTVLCLVCAVAGSARAAAVRSRPDLSPTRKKLIANGWEFNSLTPRDLQRLEDALRDGPFDGAIIGYHVEGGDGDEPCTISTVASGREWKKEWFAEEVKALQAFHPSTFTNNFLRAFITPFQGPNRLAVTRLPWAEDDRWAALANNLGVLAWVAKQGGLKGLYLDPEEYAHLGQWVYQHPDGDYEATAALARRRGAEIMHAIAREYPDITLILAWLFGYRPETAAGETTSESVRGRGDLWTAFVNGILDALPPQATLVDTTKTAYLFQGRDFVDHANRVRNQYVAFAAPENRAKYRAQVQVGFGLYIDMDCNALDQRWHFDPLNGSRAHRLRQTVADALAATDEYVWLYGEQGCWAHWKTDHIDYTDRPLWEDLLPGAAAAVKLARDPEGEGSKEIETRRERGQLRNLLDAASTIKSVRAAATVDRFDEWNDAVTEEWLIQEFPVRPGEWYAVEGRGKADGPHAWSLHVKWETQSGRLGEGYKDRLIYFRGESGNAFGVVSVPDGAVRMALQLRVSQPGTGERCRVSDVGVYSLDTDSY